MTDRMAALMSLSIGDIFHARSPNGASMVCLVTQVSDHTIEARRITTQEDCQFDRHTGFSLGEVASKIDCVVLLPSSIHDTYLEMDRRYGIIMKLIRNGVEPDPERYKLTAAEKRALLYIDDHLAEYLI